MLEETICIAEKLEKKQGWEKKPHQNSVQTGPFKDIIVEKLSAEGSKQ